MDIRRPLYQAIASALAGLLFLNPIVATAAQLAVDAAAGGNTSLGAAGNGVPVVNIATPNGAGLSHNKFGDYNVGQQGLILNNATGKTASTQLGGIVLGNPNLKGQAAQKILNEVTGGNPSQLQGYTEVAGQGAHVIVANPHGVTCDGCGFINTPRATLTTGKPILAGERLQGYDVDGGEISIEGAGLDASGVDQFELITRSAKLNAQLQARQLAVVAGRNQVDAETLAATAKADDGSARPQLAIDSSALGGMYANSIRLVGTEAGVGVRLAGNMAASAGDIRLDANGKLEVAQAAASGDLALKGQDVSLNGPAYAGGNVEVQAGGALSNAQSLAAGHGVQLNAATLSNDGQIVAGIAGQTRVAGQGLGIVAGSVNNRGRLDASGTLDLHSDTLDNSGQAYADRLAIDARRQLDNHGTLQGREASLSTRQFNNLGADAQLIGEASLLLGAPAIANLGGLIRFGDGQAASLAFSHLDNRDGRLEANGGSLALSGGSLDNQRGRIVAGSARIDALRVDNSGGLIGSSAGDLVLNVQGDLNNAGGKLQAAQALSLGADALDNRGGTLVGDALELTGGSLDNRQGGVLSAERGDLTLRLGGALDNGAGLAQAGGTLLLDVGSVSNAAGKLLAQSLDLTAHGALDNSNGTLAAEQVSLRAGNLANRNGRVQADGALELDAGDLDNNAGLLLGGTLRAGLASLSDNSGGTLSADGLLKLTVAQALNNALGRLQSTQGDVDVSAASLDNRQGTVAGGQLLLRTAGTLDNRGGRIVGDGVQASAEVIDNGSQGLLVAGAQGLTLGARQRLSNDQGRIQSDAALHLDAPRLENRGGVVLGHSLELQGGDLDNSQGGALVGNGGQVGLALDGVLNNATGLIDAGDQALLFSRALAELDNRGGTLRGERLELLAGSLDNSASGRLLAGAGGLSLTAGALNNQRGLVYAQGGEVSLDLGAGGLQNQGGAVQGDSVGISAARLDNSQANGEAGLVAGLLGKLELLVGEVINRGGQLFARDVLSVTGASLDNSGGQLSGDSVVLSDSGALNNQGGLIEAAEALGLDSGSLDNSQGGRLRALGGADSHIRSLGQLNNQGGSIGVASQAFTLSSGTSLLNAQGRIEHAGAGLFGLSAGTLSGAGSLTGLGSGLWQLGSVNGVGQVRLNGALDLRVTQGLEIAAGERIASAGGLSLTAASLNNSGELLSDGDLGLHLSGDAYNAGLLSAQRGLTLDAGNLTQRGGRLASGGDSVLTLGGTLDNQGWLIANQALRASAAQVNNNGTLGALGALAISSQGIANGADSLLFSGADMTLRAASLSNRYGDLYSQGNLSFAGLDGGRAQSFSNRSGTIEAQGDIGLDVASLENVRDLFAVEQVTSAGTFDVQCGQHCGGHDSFKRGKINVNETLSERITQNSPAAWLTAGGNLRIDADAVENRNSTIAANGDLAVNANSLLNQGSVSRTGNKVVVVNVVAGDHGKIPTGQWDDMADLARAFNTKMAAGTFDQGLYDQLWAIYGGDRWAIGTPVITWSEDGSESAAATLQAGNRVTLNVANSLQNGTVTDYSRAQLTGQLAGSLLGSQVGTVNLTLNPQAGDAQARAPQSVQSVTHTAADGSQQVSFIPVDYSGVPFAAVDPTAADTFRLPQGQYGMFIRSPDPQSHYLIESNPALTDLGRFLNSDYLLGQLGYDPDQAWKRLGDGAYETRLVREAIQAQTGQRFLDGLTSDYDQFQYLMDNALAAKDALNLSVGVGLSAEQVAALTHDIVWMEKRVVDGQEVLVPVVYLAQTEERNLRGGSLIQGRDLNLMAGGDLVNVGTLRASEDLSASAGGSILQGGLVDAGQRVSLLAGDSIRNALAGQIRGDQVDLTALKGDIVNDRTAVTAGIGGGEYRSFLDAGAGISARSDLSLDAGRDISNRGSLASGGDSYLGAGRDINLEAVADASHLRDIQQGGHHVTTTSVVQNHGSTLAAGGDLVLDAGRDLNVVGSQASAKGDLSAGAGRDINLSAVEDAASVEVRSKTSSTRTVEQTGQTRQQGAQLSAGGDLSASAGQDLNLTASTISASNEAYLYAARDVNLHAAAETDSHALSKTKRSHGLLSSSEKKTEDSSLYTTQQGSLVSADKIAIRAGQDIGVSASDVASTHGTSLLAGRNVLIDGATETS
ncbi:filamentous hemagglutinin N-terminal domain-containing protein, partial [Pseudomonas citronellolis]|uniref:two-partner secretion domain-containing protein n=1 Tax=Pseudomonas citronellolis TaxID=53408 RepID=UPI0023E36BA0